MATNVSKNGEELNFEWIVPDQWKFTNTKVIPCTGKLSPGESQVCKILVKPEHHATIYDFEIICRILNETENVIV